jgi:hypothetical protein
MLAASHCATALFGFVLLALGFLELTHRMERRAV